MQDMSDLEILRRLLPHYIFIIIYNLKENTKVLRVFKLLRDANLFDAVNRGTDLDFIKI